MRLSNRVALITGAAGGAGKEIARSCLREGAEVMIADINQAGAYAAAEAIGGSERRAIGIAMNAISELRGSARQGDRLALGGMKHISINPGRRRRSTDKTPYAVTTGGAD